MPRLEQQTACPTRAGIDVTVTNIFRALETLKVRYAVMRNYELFPTLQLDDKSPHTDIDLVVDSRDLAAFRILLTNIASQDGWDILIECDHWAQSSVRAHNVEVFRFCRFDPLEHLQVDVFHGILILGLPFAEEEQMLEGRVYDMTRCLTRIDPIRENLHRMLQIYGLYPGARRKRRRYRDKLLAFRALNREAFDCALLKRLSRLGIRAANALEEDDELAFRRNMRRARFRFLMHYAMRHPFSVPKSLYSRLRENIQRFYTRQCGAVIRTATRDEAQRQTVREIMTELIAASFIDHSRELDQDASRTISDYKEMEQGALLIEWNQTRPDVDLRHQQSRDQMLHAIVDWWARRHKALFVRAARSIGSAANVGA